MKKRDTRRSTSITILACGFICLMAAKGAAEYATLSFAAGNEGALPNTIKAGKTIEVDLAAIPRDTEIVRAILRPGRDEREAFAQRNRPVEIRAAAGDKPLPFLPPRFRAFDATEAVAQAVQSGAGKVVFPVVSFPGYQPPRTRLDVTCKAKPRNPIRRVTGIQAFHRAGQTFVTWHEADPPIAAEETTFKQWNEVRKQLSQQSKEIRYRIYRSTEPFSAASFARAQLVDEVGPLTCWNPDFYGVSPKDEQKVLRYTLHDEKSSVPPGTGIYVHNPAQAGKAYYAVGLAWNGEEDLSVFDEGNATREAVAETVGQGIPVAQRVVKPDKGFQYVEGETVLHYFIRWEAPPNCNLPSTPYDYLVAIPPKHKEPFPVGLHLHCWGGSLDGGYGWWYNAGQGALLLSTNQIPYDWWTGYHEYRGTWKSWSEGVVRDYSQRRILSFLDWIATWRKIDRTRIFTAGSSMGGSGAPSFGIRYGDKIAWAVSWVGVHVPADSPQFKGSYEQVYGQVEWRLPFADGKSAAFDYFDDVRFLQSDPARDTPLICFSNGKNDGAIGWPQAHAFWKALQDTRRPHLFVWGQGGHGQRALLPGPNPGERELGVDVRLDRTLPAFTNCSLDGNPGNGDPRDGDPAGQSNLYLYWDSADDAMVDQPDRWAMTLLLNGKAPKEDCAVDVTPRRCQRFKPRPGETCRWTITDVSDGKVLQSGTSVADRWGLVTAGNAIVSKAKRRILFAR